MKKIVSAILALAMALSLCTLSVQAGTAGKYAITYEAIGDADINNLKANDMFWAVVTLKGAEGLFSGAISFSWDNTKIQTVNASGSSNKVFGVITEAASRIVNTAKTTGMNMDTGEMEDVAAFEYNTQTATENSITYEFSAAQVYDENGEGAFNDYPLSGDATIMKVRFKVLEATDPKITVVTSKVLETKADGSTTKDVACDVAAFPIGGGEDKTEATIGATGDVTFDYAEGDSASSALNGKRVVLDTAGNKITGNVKDKKVAVTYTNGTTTETKTFGSTLNKLLGLDGDGSVTATVRFGIVCDSSLTGTFTFAIVD